MKKEISKYLAINSLNITFFWKGRVALYAILKSIGIEPGDEIILPAFTCVVVVNPIIYLGAKPVYVDIDPNTYNIDISLIERKITSRTKAILAQNTFGLSSDLDKIIEIANRYKLVVIEDCTHGFGGFYKGQKNGLVADVSFFSTQWNKPFSTGIGGFAVTKNRELSAKLIEYENTLIKPRNIEKIVLRALLLLHEKLDSKLYWPAIKIYRWLSQNNLIIGSSQGDELTKPIMPVGFVKGMSDIQLNYGKKEVKQIDQITEHRRVIANIYKKQLIEIHIEPPFEPEYAIHTYLKYPVLVRDRVKFIALAQKNNIELGDWFLSPIHPITENFESFYYYMGENRIAETISRYIINLPTHSGISENDAIRIAKFIKKNKDQIFSSCREIINKNDRKERSC